MAGMATSKGWAILFQVVTVSTERFSVERWKQFAFDLVSVYCVSPIGSQNSYHFLNQLEPEQKPIAPRSHVFSRARRPLHAFASNLIGLFITLFAPVVIGQGNYFGFGFTTLSRKPLN